MTLRPRPRAVAPAAVAAAALLALLALLVPPEAIAADRPLPQRPVPQLPGLGPDVRRVVVDPTRPPWRGLARVQTELGSHCTGFLVSPSIVMTAAHCLYLPKVAGYVRPNHVHVLLEPDLDRWVAHAVARAISIPPAYDEPHEARTASLDRAILTLDHPIGTGDDVFRLATRLPALGARLMLAGYGQDRITRPVADTTCHYLGEAAGLIRHDCAATRGASGAPLLAQEDGAWRVIGVDIEADLGGPGGLAASLIPGGPAAPPVPGTPPP